MVCAYCNVTRNGRSSSLHVQWEIRYFTKERFLTWAGSTWRRVRWRRGAWDWGRWSSRRRRSSQSTYNQQQEPRKCPHRCEVSHSPHAFVLQQDWHGQTAGVDGFHALADVTQLRVRQQRFRLAQLQLKTTQNFTSCDHLTRIQGRREVEQHLHGEVESVQVAQVVSQLSATAVARPRPNTSTDAPPAQQNIHVFTNTQAQKSMHKLLALSTKDSDCGMKGNETRGKKNIDLSAWHKQSEQDNAIKTTKSERGWRTRATRLTSLRRWRFQSQRCVDQSATSYFPILLVLLQRHVFENHQTERIFLKHLHLTQ